MSKFQDSIEVFSLRGKRVALPQALTTIEVDSFADSAIPTATLYRVRVEVGGTVMIDDRDGRALDYQTKAMKLSIAHEIYGDVHATLREMYPLLATLKLAAYRDFGAFEALKALEQKIQALHDAITPA